MKNGRVVSLLPAATEIVCALGAGARLVGRSHECDYPPEVASLPPCTSARLDANAPSDEIHRQVTSRGAEGTSLYELKADLLRELQPNVIITQAQCDVCAVSLADVEAAFAQVGGGRPRIISLAPNRLADIWDDMLRVAQALELGDAGREAVRTLKQRVVKVIEVACVLKQRPRVACVEWIEPLMAAGNWVPELVDLAGGANVAGEAGKHSPWLEWATLQQIDPEVIIIMPCGLDLQRTRAEAAALTRRSEWTKLRAVKKRNVFVTDGNHFFNRPGPRVVESLEILAEIMHPKLFNFGHAGKLWGTLS